MSEEMSLEEYRRLMHLPIDGEDELPKPSKMGNVKSVVDGHKFDSDKEVRRYSELKLLVMDGQIRELEPHKTFMLQEAFRNRFGEWVNAITYTPDFFYYDCEIETYVAEDIKGQGKPRPGKKTFTTRTSSFEIKRKLFEKRYPEIRFRVVV